MGYVPRGQCIPSLLLVIGSIIFLLAPLALTAPTKIDCKQDTCSPDPSCCKPQESSRLKYITGNTYTYNFETEVVTRLTQTTDDESRIKIKGRALLLAKSTCEFVLTVKGTKIVGPTREITKTNGLASFEGTSLRFSMQDGAIGGVCSESTDPSWSVNIKRGLASMLQNTARKDGSDDPVMETDISGKCPTTYTVAGNTYTKTKDLQSCTSRDGGLWLLQGTPYKVASEQNSSPIFNSSHICHQTFTDQKIISSVNCSETFSLLFVQDGKSEAISKVTTSLIHNPTSTEKSTASFSHSKNPTSILFDHSKTDVGGIAANLAVQNTKLLLTDLCMQTRSGTVTAVVPAVINSLRKTIRAIRRATDLTTIYNTISTDSQCSSAAVKIFVDTVAKAGTTESIVFITGLIGQGKMEKFTEGIFSVYASFAPRPDNAALSAFNTLLRMTEVDPTLLLTASGVAHRYCIETNPNCEKNTAYIDLVNVIGQIGRESCMAQEEKAIKLGLHALQALGNLDSLTPEAVGKIKECMKSTDRMKMAAIEAFRRNPCQSDLKEMAYGILKDIKVSSELRIQGYLAITRCFKQEDVQKLQQILNAEKSNQVGSFISSHVANILTSPNPMKREARLAFKQLTLPKQFPADSRKFSTNFDYSTFSAKDNLGVDAEANLIFSQDSYVPRSVSCKLDAQFLGRSYNFFEIGLYAEKFEHMLEKLAAKLLTKSFDADSSASREKRAIPSSPVNRNTVEKKLGEATRMKDNFGSNGFGDYYIRFLETTLYSGSFSQDGLRENLRRGKVYSIFDQLIEGAKDHNIKATEPITFLDDEFVIPTVSGLPLNFETEATAVLSLQMSGKLDIRGLVNRDANTDTKLRFVPSAATLIRSKMSVGAGPIESGLQFEGKLHSATGIDLDVSRDDGKFEMKLNLPEDKVQVLSMRTQLVWVESENFMLTETPLISKFASKRASTPLCTESSKIGLRLCAQFQLPEYGDTKAPAFPMAGDSLLGFSIEKTEPSMEGYHFKIQTVLKSDTEKNISILFNTPGSTTNREIKADGHYIMGQSPKLDLDVTLPGDHLNVVYQKWNEDSIKGYEMKYVRGNDVYSAGATLKITDNTRANTKTYEPLISFNFPSTSGTFLQGKIIRDTGKHLEFDLKVNEAMSKEFRTNLSGTVQRNKIDSKNTEFAFKDVKMDSAMFGKLSIDGTADFKEIKKALNVTAKYGDQNQHDLVIETQLSKPAPKANKFVFSVSSSRRSFANFDLKYDSVETLNGMEKSFLLERGINTDSQFRLYQSSNYSVESNKSFDIRTKIELSYPKGGYDWRLKADAVNNLQQQLGDFELRMGSDVSALVKYTASGEDFSNYDVNGNVTFPGQSLKFSENSVKLGPTKWKYLTAFSSTPEGRSPFTLNADTDLILNNVNDDIQTELLSSISSSAFETPLTLSSNVVSRKDNYHTHLILSKSTGEDIFNLASDYGRGIDKSPSNFTSKIFIKSYLDARLEENHGRGPVLASYVKVSATWIPTGRKIIVSSNLRKTQDEMFRYDGSVQWNATNPNKSVSISSATRMSNTQAVALVESRNTLNLMGSQHGLSYSSRYGSEYNRKRDRSVNATYTPPIGQFYSIQLKNTNEYSDRMLGNSLGAILNLPNQKPFQLDLSQRTTHINMSNYVFDFTSDLSVTYEGSEAFRLKADTKSVVTNKRTIAALFNATGSSLSNPLYVDFKSELQAGNIKNAGNVAYGTKGGKCEFEIQYDNWSPKSTLDVKYKLSTPFTNLRNIDATYKMGYIYTKYDNYEYLSIGNISVNGATPTTWDIGASHLKTNFHSHYNIYPDGKPLITYTGKGLFGDKKITFKGHGTYRDCTETKFLLDTDRNFNSVLFDYALNTSIKGYDHFEIFLRHKPRGRQGQGYTTSLQGSRNNETVTLSSKVDLSNVKKGIILAYTDKTGVKQLTFNLGGLNTNNYTVESVMSWGGDKFISTTGNLLRTDSIFGGDLTIHSPVNKIENWTIQVSQTATPNGGNILSFYVLSAQEEQGYVVVEYVKKNTPLLSNFDGSVAVKLGSDANWGGTFELEDKTYTVQRNSEAGRGITLTLHLKSEEYPLTLVIGGKRTSDEQFYETKFCHTRDTDCLKADLSYKEVKGQDVTDGFEFVTHLCSKDEQECRNFEVKRTKVNSTSTRKIGGDEIIIRLNSTTDGKSLSDGLVIKNLEKYDTTKNERNYIEYSAKLVSSNGESEIEEENHPLGFKIFKNLEISDPESGLEIYLPEREIGILYTLKNRDATTEDVVEAWLDRFRKPTQKLTFSMVFDKKDLYTILLKLPELKELKVTSQIKNSDGYTYDTNTVLDIFKTGQEPLTVIFKVKNATEDIYAVDVGLEGLLTFSAHSDIEMTRGEHSSKTTFSYLNSIQKMKNYQLNMECGEDHRRIEFLGPEGRNLLFSSQQTNDYDSTIVRREIFVPGMENSMIVERSVSSSFPQSVHAKLYTNQSSDSYEAWIGFKSDQEFVAQVFSRTGHRRRSIADINVALNNTRLMFVKSTWEKDDIKAGWEKVTDKLTDLSVKFKQTNYAATEKVKSEAEHVSNVITKALPGLKPLSTYYSTEIEDMKDELKDAKILNPYIRAYVEFFLNIFGTDFQEIKKTGRDICDWVETQVKSAIKSLQTIPEFINSMIEAYPRMRETLQKGIHKTLQFFRDISNKILKRIYGTFDKVSESYGSGSSFTFLSNTSEGIGKFLKESLVQTLQTMSNAWKKVESKMAVFSESNVVQKYVTYYKDKYQQIAKVTLGEYQKDLEAMRDSVLTAFPDREYQEFMLSVVQYIEKKAKQEVMDDAAEQAEIYDKFVKAVEKMKTNLFTIDLNNGLIIARVPLPLPIKSLADFEVSFTKAVASYSFQRPAHTYNLLDVYNQLKAPGSSLRDFLPPFKGKGLLMGSQYYKTFDNKFFHFEGKCQYILAADFVDNNFTLVVDYSESNSHEVKKSITLTNLKDDITIKSDHTVLFNGKTTSVPASSGELKVEKQNNWIMARGPTGFSVACSTLQDVCVFKISGFYQGKTNGLLGTFNHEDFDDMNSPSGEIVNSVDTMAAGWKLGECQERALPVHSGPIDAIVQQKCATAFNGTSSKLKPCFSVENPSEYKWTCESLSREKGYDGNRAICTSTTAYQEICNLSGTPVEDSEQCISN